MDPIATALVAAATAGAAAGLTDAAKTAICDAYKSLKALIKMAFGDGNAVTEAAERLEAKPDSDARKQEVAEAVAETRAADHADIVAVAEALLAKLSETPAGAQHQSAVGSYIAQAMGGSTAKVNVNRRD